MADQATMESLGWKFQEWAQSLSDDEQATLAEWMRGAWGDVTPHDANWWRAQDAWSRAWSQSWSHDWAESPAQQ